MLRVRRVSRSKARIVIIPHCKMTAVLMFNLTNQPLTNMLRIVLTICIQLLLCTDVVAEVTFDKPPSGSVTVSIAEDKATGSDIYSLQATATAGYSLAFTIREQSPSTPAFSIDETSQQLIVPSQGLDAETVTQFNFTFKVTAGPDTVDSGLLIVRVTDVNDNEPVFGNTSYTGKVWKNDPAGTHITTVSATDPDISNRPISYSIAGTQGTFSVDSSGVITLAYPRGLTSLFPKTDLVLPVYAYDDGRTGTATVTVTVYGDPCSATPCQNGGTCISTRDNYTCTCLSGYRGQQCQLVDYCHQSPCQHSGTCSNEAENHKCACFLPFTGQNCTELREEIHVLSKTAACTPSTFLIGLIITIVVIVL